MKTVKSFVAFAALSLGSLTGCGGVEDAEPAGQDTLQSVEQAVCSSPPYSGGCSGSMHMVSPSLTCTASGLTFTYYCPYLSSCMVLGCVGTVWDYRIVPGYMCENLGQNYCTP
jgi:hypothetical protein